MASDEDIAKYRRRVLKAEREIKRLHEELQSLGDPAKLLEEGFASPELEELRTENQKLKYRKMHLLRNLEDERKRKREHAIDVRGIIEDVFTVAIRTAYPELADPLILVVPSPKFADYQCNSAMSIAQHLGKITGQKVNARDVAQVIISNLPHIDIFEKVESAGPGFINIYLKKEFITNEILSILNSGIKPPKVRKQRVVIDFSSPNIAKEMHVGHLRSTIIGESLSRLLEWVGHDVLRLNHLGDWGTQFGMLIAHLMDKFPNLLEERPSLTDLMAFYKESKQRFDNEEDFKKRAYECVVKLQAREPFYIKAWKIIYDISMGVNNSIYKCLDVSIIERGESFYQERMVKLVADLEAKGLLETDEGGRKILYVPGCEVPLIVVKSDGGFTYDTSDLATIYNRLHEENGEWLIYVVDSGQGSHFNAIFGAAEKIGWTEKGSHRIDHVNFGVVLGEDKKKFKSRSGENVRLRDLLDEGLRRAESKLKDNGRDKELSAAELTQVKESVAFGCIKYADLSHNRTHDYVFSFDKMLDDRGNTAVYLLYAYTRIRSIARSANTSASDLAKAASQGRLELSHPAEWKLAKCIVRFFEVITRVLQDLLLHTLCDYIYELTATFTEFYDKCYCIEKDKATGKIIKVNMSRLLLCEATASVIKTAFHIVGIQPLDKM